MLTLMLFNTEMCIIFFQTIEQFYYVKWFYKQVILLIRFNVRGT